MTGKERIRAFLNGEKVDWIPNVFGACETAEVHSAAYHTMKRTLGLTDERNRFYTFMCNAVFEPSVFEAIGGDMVIANSRMCPSDMWEPRSDYFDAPPAIFSEERSHRDPEPLASAFNPAHEIEE